jgi:hypothetical protein
LLLATALVTAGCGGDSSEDLTTDEAAQQYEQLVTPFNDALSDLQEELKSTPIDLAEVSDAAGRYVAEAKELQTGLKGQDWPDDVSADVVDLSAALERMIPAGQSLVDDSSVDELTTDLQELAAAVDEGTASAGAIRTKLGLEDAPTLS